MENYMNNTVDNLASKLVTLPKLTDDFSLFNVPKNDLNFSLDRKLSDQLLSTKTGPQSGCTSLE